MATLLRAVYKLNTIRIKTQMTVFTELEKYIHMGLQKTELPKEH